ncbi:hypothetical protein NDU88_005498 [Pleurodeles waltl]|uniref:Reverse transcriptase/retrotransposon-derived protein RNase H-like domain-containing protein n=1 Tax=Pleurodeles waltl TaxID=8319 RepID=A0AAV7TCV1_PLEWA|nr:hypothetical protein NDU88_005498 [Pleurodeles waltl]
MVSYCRQWIPGFSTLAKPLLKLTQKDALDEIVLKRDEMDAFIELKECMCRAPALGMPDYTKPFTLFCHERDACSLSVLTQAHGGVNRPVAYFSATLDPVAAALPGCLRAVAAVGISLNQSEGIVMGHPLTVMVPHSVEILLTRSRTQYMTGARLTRYETIILGSPNVQLKRCTTLNPAALFPSENVEIENAEDIEHDCLQVTEFCTKPRPDIKDTRLEENDKVIFVDDSCLRDAVEILKAGYAVEATTLPPIQGPGHALKAGDWVVIKKHVRKSCLEPRWKGPFQVILTTTTAVKCAGVPNWIHASHTKRVTCPTEEEVEALKSPVTDKRVPSTETGQREPGGEQAEIEEGEIFSEEETADPFEEDRGEASGSDEDPEGDKEPATGEGAGEPDQRRAFPLADDTGKEKENLIDLLGGEDKTGQSEIVQTLLKPVAGPSGENSAKWRQSISPVKSRSKEILNESEGPTLKEKRKEVAVAITTPSEEKDPAMEQGTSERESKGDAKLKRKRIPSRRYSGPEWAYIATNDW